MGARTASLERQHKLAKSRLAECENALNTAGIEGDALRRHPKWRSVRADCRTIARRLNRAREIENFTPSEPHE